MSQRHVESFIGRLATDRELRRAFALSPAQAIATYRSDGFDLASVEVAALEKIDINAINSLAETVDARLRRLGPTGAFNVADIGRKP